MRQKFWLPQASQLTGTNMLIAAIALWLSALSAYCCSKQQSLLERPLSKLSGWGIFVILFFIAWLFLLGDYSSLSAFFLAFSYVMAAWLAMIFILGHFQMSLWKFGSAGVALSIAIFYVGLM